MEFFNFLKKESGEFDRRLLASAVFAGIVNTLLIFILTAAALTASTGRSNVLELALVILCLSAFWISKGYLMRKTAVIVEEIIHHTRIRLAQKVRNSDLASFEMMGDSPLYNVISTHAAHISRGSTGIVSGASSLVLLLCAFLVIYCMSATAFLLLIATLALIILAFMADRAKILAGMDAVSKQENKVVAGFSDLMRGFKELKMNSARNREFFDRRLDPVVLTARELRTSTGLVVNKSVLLATSSLFIMLGAVVFLLPVLAPADAHKLARISTIIVFIFGPLGEVVGVYPYFSQAVASIRELYRIEGELDTIFESGHGDPLPEHDSTLTFETLACHELGFSYRNEKGEPMFSLAPLDFHLARGEIVFITGGNGSGKSTFLKVLAGLYPPASGSIMLNQRVVGLDNRQAYRDLFAAVFSDYHLFDYLFGIPAVDPERVRELLHLTGLLEKTTIVDKQISQTNLSSGQKKRLALVVALLEDKPVFLFDEWAAEQDPQFRRKFYREILPSLKQRGKAVVAVTHDDDHYDTADRVLKMQYGKFVPWHHETPG